MGLNHFVVTIKSIWWLYIQSVCWCGRSVGPDMWQLIINCAFVGRCTK